ncbi:MAG: DegT/DnrJ/EryC1/StrS family aminotransferase [Terriglobia bacterium]
MRKKDLTRREFLGRTSASLAVAGVATTRARTASGNPNALALNGGTPVRSTPYPGWPQTNELDEANILKSLRNHRWCTYDGEFIPKFEKAWAEELGVRGAVMTPCGTHALHTAVDIVGISPGDEVLVAPFTYIATVDAILLNYALPVFVDTDLKTFQMDPDDIEHRITEHTRAILPVHILGAPANMDRILAIAKKHNLPVIEDACQGHTAEWKGKRLGTLGTVGCFSFQESKVLPGGEAGALVSNDEELIRKAYMFRDFGRNPEFNESFLVRGTKYRISDFAAAVLMAQITRFKEYCEVREKNAAYLREELKQVPGIHPQEHYPQSTRQSYYCFGLRYDKGHFHGLSHQHVTRALQAEGIPVQGFYTPPLNREPYLEHTLNSRGFQTVFSKERLKRFRDQNHCPRNDELCETMLYMSQGVLLASRRDTQDIVEAFAKVQKNASSIQAA